MTISGLRKSENKIFLQIKRDQNTQKQYNRFKQKLKDKYNISVVFPESYEEWTGLEGKGFSIDVFYFPEYLYIVINGDKNSIKEISDFIDIFRS